MHANDYEDYVRQVSKHIVRQIKSQPAFPVENQVLVYGYSKDYPPDVTASLIITEAIEQAKRRAGLSNRATLKRCMLFVPA